MDKYVGVVGALITDGNKFLIGRRPENKKRGLLWEFVGGKIEKGESGEAALVRECKEELDITVEPESVFIETQFEYEDIKIKFIVYRAKIAHGEIKMLEHCDIRWITPEEIDEYDFCPADADVLKKIKKEGI